jgi:hypothetical protein
MACETCKNPFSGKGGRVGDYVKLTMLEKSALTCDECSLVVKAVSHYLKVELASPLPPKNYWAVLLGYRSPTIHLYRMLDDHEDEDENGGEQVGRLVYYCAPGNTISCRYWRYLFISKF